VVDGSVYGVTVFTIQLGRLTPKFYDEGARVLRIDVIVHSVRELRCGKAA